MRKIYVYIPGFEYDSKGPLHIDAIELNAWAAEGDSEESQKLKTYIYIGKNFPSIEGSIIYRCVYSNSDYIGGNNFSWIKDRYDDSVISNKVKEPFASSYACIHRNSAAAPIMINRAMTGSYYDFVTISGETTHHIIGMYDTVSYCKDIRNLDTEQHDGLFAIEVENLNTDIILKFNLYSRVNTSEDGTSSEVGIKEDISTVRENINNKNNVIDTSQYIKVGEFTKTYNPAISEVSQDNIYFPVDDSDKLSQYFDWSLGGNDWEIPVNAGLLATKRGTEIQLNNVGNNQTNGQRKLQKYNTTLKQFTEENLPCDNFSEKDFYLNFYSYSPKNLPLDKDFLSSESKGNTIFGNANGSLFGDLLTLWLCATAFKVSSKQVSDAEFEYKLCKADLSNLSYLYTKQLKVKVTNDSADKIAVAINSWGRKIVNSDPTLDLEVMADNSALDCYHFNQKLDKRLHTLNYYFGEEDLTDSLIRNDGPASVYVQCEQSISGEKFRIFDATLDLNYINEFDAETSDILTTQIKTYNNKRELPSGDKISYHADDLSSLEYREKVRSLYLNKVLETEGSISSSILTSADVNPLNTNKVGLYFKCSDINFPVIGYDAKTENKSYTYSAHNNFNHGFKFADILSSILNRGIGTVSIFVPLTFYIDLDLSDISLTNKGAYSIYSKLQMNNGSTFVGFLGKNAAEINIESTYTNLLVPTSSQQEGFEIEKVIADSEILKRPRELKLNSSTKFQSSVCDDKRFIGNNTLSIKINKSFTADLDGLYVLKVLAYKNAGFKANFTIIPNSGENVYHENINSNKGLWAFYLKKNDTLKVEELIKPYDVYTYNVISGIGLYRVDFTKTDTNTQVLKSTAENYKDKSLYILPTSGELDDYIYNYIVFPAVFCVKEDIEICKRLDEFPYVGIARAINNTNLHSLQTQNTKSQSQDPSYNPDYDNDYCSSVKDDPIYHYYNFKYLPEEAVYDVEGFYLIPDGSNSTIDLDKVEFLGELTKEKVTALGTINVKTAS